MVRAVTKALTFRPEQPQRFWRSPLRGPWLTSVFGAILLVGIPIEFLTGVVSWIAYDPRLQGNDVTTHHGVFSLFLFDWVTSPSWTYRVSQGTHVLLGLVLVPVLLAKLWSVIPRLFSWPPLRSLAHLLERASLMLLVSGAIFEFVTGIMNIDYDYSFGFSFYDGHFFGAWLFIAGFTVHAVLRFPRMRKALRDRSFRREMRTGLAETRPEEPEPGDDPADTLVSANPAEPTMSRRGLLALVGGSSGAVFLLTAGQSIRWLQGISVLSPRTQSYGRGPNAFQVNRTAVAAGIQPSDVRGWRLRLVAESTGREIALARDELLHMGLTTADLPIACVEGWSILERWTGVPLAALAALVGVGHPTGARVESLERNGAFASASLSGHQVRSRQSLLALSVNGADLSLDHGYPARTVIRPLRVCTIRNGSAGSPSRGSQNEPVAKEVRRRAVSSLAVRSVPRVRRLLGLDRRACAEFSAHIDLGGDSRGGSRPRPLASVRVARPRADPGQRATRLAAAARALDQPRASPGRAFRPGAADFLSTRLETLGARLPRRDRPNRAALPRAVDRADRIGVRRVSCYLRRPGCAREAPPETAMIDVVLPVLNERAALPEVIRSFPSGFRPIVVDNGSTDSSGELAGSLGAKVVFEPVRGFGSACWAGLTAATSDLVCFMDCDGSLDPKDLRIITAPVLDGGDDLAIGRRVPTSGAWPFHARLANRVLARLVRDRCGLGLRDLGPMRACRRAELLSLGLVDRRFGWPLEMVVKAAESGWRITEVDVPYSKREGRSKVTGTFRGTVRTVVDMRAVLR